MELSEKEILAVIEGYEKQGRYWVPTPGVVEQQMFMDGFLFGKEYFSHDWQDISLAPKDGKVVDLWHKDGYRRANAKWLREPQNRWRYRVPDMYSQVNHEPDDEFTHFRYITGPEDV